MIVIEKMFRESDYENCKKHETCINRPLPTLQVKAQAAKFDDLSETGITSKNYLYSRKSYAAVHDEMPKPILASFNHYYDPNHPDADW